MTARFGLSFWDELRAAGLLGLINWDDDGNIYGRENLTTEQNATLDALIAAHNPDAPLARTVHEQMLAADGGVVDLLNRAKTASVAEIDTWLGNNVTTLATARTVMSAQIKLMAIMASRLGLI